MVGTPLEQKPHTFPFLLSACGRFVWRRTGRSRDQHQWCRFRGARNTQARRKINCSPFHAAGQEQRLIPPHIHITPTNKHGNHCLHTVWRITRSHTGAAAAAPEGFWHLPCSLPARLRQKDEYGGRRRSRFLFPELFRDVDSGEVVVLPSKDVVAGRRWERRRNRLGGAGACRRFVSGLPGKGRKPPQDGQVSAPAQVQRV